MLPTNDPFPYLLLPLPLTMHYMDLPKYQLVAAEELCRGLNEFLHKKQGQPSLPLESGLEGPETE